MAADTCKLIVIENTKDSDGFPIEQQTTYDAYVLREKSARSTEFYQALSLDISIRIVLELRVEEWEQSAHNVDGEKEYASKIEYEGYLYEVVRTYQKNKSVVEIILSSGKREYMR